MTHCGLIMVDSKRITTSFLDASTHPYKKVYPSVRRLVRPSVRNAFVTNTQKRMISAPEVEGMSRAEGGGSG